MSVVSQSVAGTPESSCSVPKSRNKKSSHASVEARSLLRPTDEIRFGSGPAHSAPPIVLHPAAQTSDIASIAVARAEWMRDLMAAFIDHPNVPGDFVAGLLHPPLAELATLLGHLCDALEPCSGAASVNSPAKEVTR